ncbi:uncharacterized protein BX663DRAFT_554371 [Cokeromyces recurvatus]|nr:uncharacterized protein BX663DRAFT_554371 [Cokeromyces recurvatus]KAI7900202.1 hypothetical protein BX663DRAFT_554371 [Cokeromyces recurvatus]
MNNHRRHASEYSISLNHFLPKPLEPKIDDLTSNKTSTTRNNFYHSRSYSDYTHPYPVSINNNTSHTNHRRAYSTSTINFHQIQQNPPSLSLSHSSSSSSSSSFSFDESHKLMHQVSDSKSKLNHSTSTYKAKLITPKQHNKYICSYCTKGFSRPSSLRIHIYSHTGERPFECIEEGCNRKFSVQSNMRRHLRVHRLGKSLKRNGGCISPADRAQLINKPLAANQWI